MTKEELIAALNNIPFMDGEDMHLMVDKLIMLYINDGDIEAAYDRVIERAPYWAYA